MNLEYQLYTLSAAYMIEHQLSDPLVVQLNKYLDELLEAEDSESAAKDLVGQIHQGQQLIMDFTKPELASFKKITEDLAVAYIKHFVEHSGSMVKPKRIDMDKLWSVHSYAGDYNPIHDHLVKSNMGISFTTWTKVPEQIGQLPVGDQKFSLYDSSGAIDGYINFTYGLNQLKDPENLRPPQSKFIKPAVGKLLMFPSWMQHCVYPFTGDGERRTIAGNLNCFDLTPDQLEEYKNELQSRNL